MRRAPTSPPGESDRGLIVLDPKYGAPGRSGAAVTFTTLRAAPPI
jgi:hypothetical protein